MDKLIDQKFVKQVKVAYALTHETIFAPGDGQHGPKFMSKFEAGQRAYEMRLETVKDQGFLVVTLPIAGDFYVPLIQVRGLILEK